MKKDEKLVLFEKLLNEPIRYDVVGDYCISGHEDAGEWIEFSEFERILKKALGIGVRYRECK